jgi:hypothetical protein
LALPNLLYGFETWAITEQEKYKMTSEEITFMRRTAKHNRKDYKTNENILSELKFNPVVKKIRNYRRNMFGEWTRKKDTINHEISTVWETKPRTTAQKAF